MKTIYRVLGLTVFLFALSCNLDEDLKNPNEPALTDANVILIMNKVQFELSDFFARVAGNNTSIPASGITFTTGVDQLARMNALTEGDIYQRALTPQNGDEIWNLAYQRIMVNIEFLIPLATEAGFTNYVGIAKVLKAYVYMVLVDIYGDVPYSEAIKGTEQNLNPITTSGRTIYTDMIDLLDEAKTNLADTPAAGSGLRDIYYDGNLAKWTKFANTLQMRAYLNMGESLVDESQNGFSLFDAIVASDNFIDGDEDEFTYRYGTANVPISSRSPMYRQYYRPQKGAASGYINNYYMKRVYDGNGVQDPRWRYYFFRQVGSIDRALAVDAESVPCVLNPIPIHFARVNSPYCTFDPGFYGRDHGDNDGGPPDSNVITVIGAYPGGGLSDKNDGDQDFHFETQQGQGGNGAGIEPIFMSWFADFMRAERAIRGGDNANAKTFMLSGINKSINRVRVFAESIGQSLPSGLEPSQADYITAVEAAYDAPDADVLDIVIREYHKSLFGNGIEAYNMIRRTGSPKDLQPMRAKEGGVFFRSLIYPSVFVNLNSSVKQKDANDTRVFWDNGPELE